LHFSVAEPLSRRHQHDDLRRDSIGGDDQSQISRRWMSWIKNGARRQLKIGLREVRALQPTVR
jgi:hypothetical protein